jgi:hypothetical protein
MFDRELAKEILKQVIDAANRIDRRSKGVHNSDDFLLSDAGIVYLVVQAHPGMCAS